MQVEELPAAQVVVVSRNVDRARNAEGCFLALGQDYPQRPGNGLRDLVLDGEHVLDLTIKAL